MWSPSRSSNAPLTASGLGFGSRHLFRAHIKPRPDPGPRPRSRMISLAIGNPARKARVKFPGAIYPFRFYARENGRRGRACGCSIHFAINAFQAADLTSLGARRSFRKSHFGIHQKTTGQISPCRNLRCRERVLRGSKNPHRICRCDLSHHRSRESPGIYLLG